MADDDGSRIRAIEAYQFAQACRRSENGTRLCDKEWSRRMWVKAWQWMPAARLFAAATKEET